MAMHSSSEYKENLDKDRKMKICNQVKNAGGRSAKQDCQVTKFTMKLLTKNYKKCRECLTLPQQ